MARGGSQKYAIKTAIEFLRNGHNVSLYTIKYNEEQCYPDLLEGIEVVYLKQAQGSETKSRKNSRLWKLLTEMGLVSILRLLYDVYTGRGMAERIKANTQKGGIPLDLLYVHECTYNYLALFVKQPKYLFCYDTPDKFESWDSAYVNRDKWFKRVNGWLKILSHYNNIRRFRKIFVLDETMKDKVINYFSIAPITIPGGIDVELFSQKKRNVIREEYDLKDDTIIVSCVTRLAPYKRIEDIIVATENIESSAKVLVYINTHKEDDEYYQKLLTKYKNSIFPKGNVIIDTQPLSGDEALAAVYQSSDIFVYPNENQTWGNAVLEAMSCGCCSVVSDGCGISEIIDQNETGIIYKQGDVVQLKDILQYLVKNMDVSQRIGSLSAEIVREKYTWNNWYFNHLKEFNNGQK